MIFLFLKGGDICFFFLENSYSFSCLLSSIDIFQNDFFFFKKFFQEYNQVSNSLYPDHAQYSVRPDLGPNCLQRLSVDGTNKQRVLGKQHWHYILLKESVAATPVPLHVSQRVCHMSGESNS